ncbi:MAG: metallophosphoesterase [Gemmatimonadota bacterium]|nr:metallophosphoesterase [Gemmatimonadota bacterium]
MRVGLLADSHDRVPAIAELARRFSAAGVGFVLHAGDYCSPFSLAPFFDAHIAVAGVFGRNDGDQEGLLAEATKGVGIELYQSPHSVELEGRRILVVHDLGEVADRSLEAHEIVVYGCTHIAACEARGESLLVNPGEACGWLFGVPTAAILDVETKQVEPLRLDGPEWRQE